MSRMAISRVELSPYAATPLQILARQHQRAATTRTMASVLVAVVASVGIFVAPAVNDAVNEPPQRTAVLSDEPDSVGATHSGVGALVRGPLLTLNLASEGGDGGEAHGGDGHGGDGHGGEGHGGQGGQGGPGGAGGAGGVGGSGGTGGSGGNAEVHDDRGSTGEPAVAPPDGPGLARELLIQKRTAHEWLKVSTDSPRERVTSSPTGPWRQRLEIPSQGVGGRSEEDDRVRAGSWGADSSGARSTQGAFGDDLTLRILVFLVFLSVFSRLMTSASRHRRCAEHYHNRIYAIRISMITGATLEDATKFIDPPPATSGESVLSAVAAYLTGKGVS